MEYNRQQQAIIDCRDNNMIVVACAGSGKALDNNTGVLTPNGYVPIGKIQIGDTVFDGTGKPTQVIAVYPQGQKQVYEVEDAHGNIIRCCEDHLWKFQTKYQRDHKYGWNTKSTKEILNGFPLYIKSGSYSAKNIYLPAYDYVDFPKQKLPLPPYTMGALLGDGSFRKCTHMFTNADDDIIQRVSQELHSVGAELVYKDRYDYYIRKIDADAENYYRNIIISLGLDQTLSHQKFIPPIYLYNNIENRLELLRGLIDTDGSCEGSAYEYITVSKQLADDVELLCQSLGYTVTRGIKECSYVNDDGVRVKCKNAYRLRIKTNDANPIITYCARKTQKYKRGQTVARNCITRITPLNEYVEMTCITVASEDHTYIIEHGIVTHNTRSIVGAIHRYIKDHPTHHVTAITFTRKAAEELATRIGNNNVEVSTIHSWAYRRLQRFAAKYDFKVQLLEDDVIKDILKKLCIKRRQYYLNQWLLYSYVMGNYNVDVDEKIERVFRIIATDYVRFKRQNKLYDFTDLPLYLLDVCQEYDERIEDSDALFVDEFQDIDPVQLAVFEYVDVTKRVYIGDPKQAIYAFRGACSEVFEKFRLPDWTWFTLSINYRSHQNIADYAEAVYDKAQALIKEHDVYSAINFPALVPICGIECAKGGGGTVVLIMDMNGLMLEDCTWVDKSVEATEEYITNLVASPNTQILCRSNKQVKKLKTMGIDNVSTVHQAKGLEYDNVVLVDFPQDSEEELNIGYVAATRARNNLAVINWDLLLYYVAGMSKTEVSKGSNRLF